jgi:hypothetical protein
MVLPFLFAEGRTSALQSGQVIKMTIEVSVGLERELTVPHVEQ